MTLRSRLAALTAAALVAGAVGTTLLPTTVEAAAPAPVILNGDVPTGSNASWLETQNLTDTGHNRIVQATFLVQHAEGRTIQGVKADFNWNGSDDTAGNGVIPVGSSGGHSVEVDRYTPSAGAIQTSRVTARINVGNGPNSSGRAFNAPFRMRVVDSTGEQSASETATIRFVEDGQSTGSQDYPSIQDISIGGYVTRTPGQSVSFTIRCDDPDINFFSSDDDCNRANQRWRRLDDGSTISLSQRTGIGDNQTETITLPAPDSNGFWVFEVHLCNENGSCPTNGQGSGSSWWRLGSVSVNDPADSLDASLTFSGAEPSSPPSVNPGESVTVGASVSETGGHGAVVQIIEWNKDHNGGASGSFEERFYTVPTNSAGNIVTPNISSVPGALSRPISTTSPGLKTVRARITDNGAMDGTDDSRRQLTVTSGQLRVNALPAAADVSRTIAEDSGPTTITLNGSDPDAQPAPIVYSLVSGLADPSLGTLGSITGNTVTFTPAPNANGSTTFRYRVRDGGPSTIGANGFSNTATVTVNVTPVNDLPTVHAKTLATDEDTPGTVQLTGTDIESPSLTWSLNPGGQATNGVATCPASGLCTYAPNPDFAGTDSFVVRGTDGDGGHSTATVSVTVHPVNDAPVANDQSVTVLEDAAGASINLTASDIDNATVGFVAPVDDVDHGEVSCLGGSCTYVPDLDYNGPDSFTFRADDGSAQSNEATVSIEVTAVNDDPVATDVAVDADEDTPTPVTATGTDVDTGDVVSVADATDPANGATAVSGPNEVTYTGDLDFHGLDTFDFTVVDRNGGSDVGTATVTVHPVNDAPVIADQAFTVAEDTPTLLSIAAGDVDGDSLLWSVTDGPDAGTVVGTGPDVVYVPDANVHGADTFTVLVEDGHGGTATAVVTVTVTPVNDQPVADATAITTDEDTAVEVTLTGSDIDGDALTFTAPEQVPAIGSVTCDGPVCEYTPDPNAHGSDLFTFSVDDGHGGSDIASVSVTIQAVNDAPVAEGTFATTQEDTAVGVTLSASDVDGDSLTFTYGEPSAGTVSGSGPDAIYTPNANVSGPDSFGFTVDDNNGGTASAVVAVMVEPVNDAPVATGGSATTPEDTPVSFQLGATDVDDDALTFAVTSEPEEGAVDCAADGACSYDPEPDFSGPVTFGYSVADGELSSEGSFTIVVDPVNDPPVAQPVAVLTAEDTAVAFALHATDAEGDALSYAVVSPPGAGEVVCSVDGSCTYTPAPNGSGSDAFTWSVNDGGAEATATASITVVPVNDAPQALDVAAATQEDAPVTFFLLASDVEGDDITYSVETPPAHGSVSIAGNVATYTPAADYSGTDLFTYRATDPSGAFTVARASLVVDEVPLVDTTLVGDAAVARVLVGISGGFLNGGLTVFPRMSATLHADGGAPLPGRSLTFTVGGNVVCTAVTGADGRGECSGEAAVAALLNLGYQVSFPGDPDHSASTARGPLLQVLTLQL